MPRRNRKVVAANRDRARKHAHRHDTEMPQVDARNDMAPSWQPHLKSQNVATTSRRVYVSDK